MLLAMAHTPAARNPMTTLPPGSLSAGTLWSHVPALPCHRLGNDTDRIGAADRRSVIQKSGHATGRRACHPARGAVLKLADQVGNAIGIHVLDGALVLIVRLDAYLQTIEVERSTVDITYVQRLATQDCNRDYPVAIDVEAIGIASGLNVNLDVLAAGEHPNPVAGLSDGHAECQSVS